MLVTAPALTVIAVSLSSITWNDVPYSLAVILKSEVLAKAAVTNAAVSALTASTKPWQISAAVAVASDTYS